MVIDESPREATSIARNIRDAIFVYLLFFTSGAVIYMSASTKYLILVFSLVLVSWLLFSDRKISYGFLLYVIIFISFLFVLHLYTDGSLPIATVVGTTMELVLAYLVLRIVGPNIIGSFVNVVVFLAAISLFGFLTDRFQLFEGIIRHLPLIDDGTRSGYGGILYLYRGMGLSLARNASIFYEPGAYQMFLNTTLFMLFFVDTRISPVRRWVYISVLLIALLTTVSTTAALIFSALFGLLLIKSTVISGNAKMVLVGALILITVIFASQFRYVIFEKIGAYTAVEDIKDTSDLRSFGLLVDIEIFKRNIFGSGHAKYYEQVSAIGHIADGQVSANGISSTLAIYGLPFALFLFGSYFAFFYRYFTGFLMRVVPFSAILVFLMSEGYYILTPFSLALIAAIFAYDKEGEGSETTAAAS